MAGMLGTSNRYNNNEVVIKLKRLTVPMKYSLALLVQNSNINCARFETPHVENNNNSDYKQFRSQEAKRAKLTLHTRTYAHKRMYTHTHARTHAPRT